MTCYSGLGNLADASHPSWMGNFSRSDRAEVLFHYTGDKNWILGTFAASGELVMDLAGNTAGFGDAPVGCPTWIGNFSRSDRAEVLFHYPGDKNWWLGSHDGNQLQWSFAGNTAGFGDAPLGCPTWIGNFSRSDRAQVLFYYPGDGNWWLGSHDGNQLQWSFAANSGRPCRNFFVIHFKSLLAINNAITTFIDTQFAALENLFSEVGIAVYRGTVEDLSINRPDLATLLILDVGGCLRGQPTAEHNLLFANRFNAGPDDLVVYIVQSLVNGTATTNLVGCATHPNGRPGLAVVQSAAQWLTAHEVGHVLGLAHVPTTPASNRDRLMFPSTGWTNVPPDIVATEATTMDGSPWTRPC